MTSTFNLGGTFDKHVQYNTIIQYLPMDRQAYLLGLFLKFWHSWSLQMMRLWLGRIYTPILFTWLQEAVGADRSRKRFWAWTRSWTRTRRRQWHFFSYKPIKWTVTNWQSGSIQLKLNFSGLSGYFNVYVILSQKLLMGYLRFILPTDFCVYPYFPQMIFVFLLPGISQ